jgi:hypothetical protein
LTNAILPEGEWIPGAIAVEYVQQRLPGNYSRRSVADLLSSVLTEGGKIGVRHKHDSDEDMGNTTLLKV